MKLITSQETLLKKITEVGIKRHILDISENILADYSSNDVTVDDRAIEKTANALSKLSFQLSCWDNTAIPTGPGKLSLKKALCYFILLNSINFCFWKTENSEKWKFHFINNKWDGALGLFAFISNAFNTNKDILQILDYFIHMNDQFFHSSDLCEGSLLLAEKRTAILKRTAKQLLELQKDNFCTLINAAEKGEASFILKILQYFPDYHDPFLKRAQLLISMLHGYLCKYSTSIFSKIDDLTLFADYKVPQTLERLGIIRYSPTVCSDLIKNRIFKADSKLDHLIRAATIVSGERLLKKINAHGNNCNSAQIDFKLWVLSQKDSNTNSINIAFSECKNYHKIITTNY